MEIMWKDKNFGVIQENVVSDQFYPLLKTLPSLLHFLSIFINLAWIGMGKVAPWCSVSEGPATQEGSALEKELPPSNKPSPIAEGSNRVVLYCDSCARCYFPPPSPPSLKDDYKMDKWICYCLKLWNTTIKPFFFYIWGIRKSLNWWTFVVESLCLLSFNLPHSIAYVGSKQKILLLPWKMLFFLGPEASLLSLASNNPSVHPYVKATLLS